MNAKPVNENAETIDDSTLYRMVAPNRFAPLKKEPTTVNWRKWLLHPKAIVMAGAISFVLAGIFPPWLYTVYETGNSYHSGKRGELNAGYYCLFNPPAPKDEFEGVKLDGERLLVELACVAVATGAMWFVCKRQPTEDR